MSDEPALFGLPDNYQPPTPAADLSHTERRNRVVDRRIADRIHPLGGLSLHPNAATGREGDGLRCGSCQWRQTNSYHNRTYPKCMYGGGRRATHGEASDVRAWWPACRDHEQEVDG